MLILFLLSVTFCVYTYALFPLLLHWRARSAAPIASTEPNQWPSVSIVIAAHNEALRLERKLASLAQLDYPKGLLQTVFVSDGSTDNTLSLLQQASETDPSITVHHYAPAAGKPTALNKGVAVATGEVLVFMDARQTVSENAIKVLVSHLLQERIGAVSGELVLADDNGQEATNVGLYWQYEKWIRHNESRLFSTTGATGALYSVRKKDYVSHTRDVLLDDFDTPVNLLGKGLRTVLAPDAKVFDQAEGQASQEFQRKSRTLAGNFQSFARSPWLFSPTKNPVFGQFLSHKVFRLLVPYAMTLALLACVFGSGWFLKVMLFLQLGFYGLGVAGLLGAEHKVINFIKVFLVLNAAAVVGAYRYFSGKTSVRWRQS